MKLVSDDVLERSAVVANCRMNRERRLTGSNGYEKELGFDPLGLLRTRLAPGRRAAWLDLCCGTGRALIEAARIARDEGWADRVSIVGVDLVGMFDRPEPGLGSLRLVESSWRPWHPEGTLDLITCVHGLHYVGDKLGLIARAASWLADDGLFAANLDPSNLKVERGDPSGRRLLATLRRAGLRYDPRRRLLTCAGRRELRLPYAYLGADDRAGPNSTGQHAVCSYYARIDPARAAAVRCG